MLPMPTRAPAQPRPGAGGSRAYTSIVSRRQVERRLREVGQRLQKLREELQIADEQLLHLSETADDARLRALVSETPVAEREHREAARHAESMRTHRASVATEIARLEAAQDELLDRLLAETS
jgi:flagellar biosynthesis chaperone FliJ